MWPITEQGPKEISLSDRNHWHADAFTPKSDQFLISPPALACGQGGKGGGGGGIDPFHGSRPIKMTFHVSRKIGDFLSYNLQSTAYHNLASVMLLLEFHTSGMGMLVKPSSVLSEGPTISGTDPGNHERGGRALAGASC